MDKSKLRTFAIESRRRLIEDTKFQASLLGITDQEIKEPVTSAKGMETYQISSSTNHTIYDDEIEQRKHLVNEIKQKGFDQVIEEVAYTWFNRIIAIRYMEVNDYLPTRTRVLSSETPGKIEPDMITEALDLDLDYNGEDIDKILELKESNKLDELFKFLFIKQCNKLNDILPNLFEKTSDFTELLFNLSFTSSNDFVQKLIEDIPEEDFTEQVEIIGWLYQYYNAELKDETFKTIKKDKVPKERIPAATQLFTPDWIVRYMVENSLGKLWLEGHPNENLENKWKYYLKPAKQEESVEKELFAIAKNSQNLNIEDIMLIDPSMGSGHILVYAFDVLMQIYTSIGYSEKDASILILENNLYGLDIDDRAYQLAYFALMMKARQYNRRIFKTDVKLNLTSIQETNNISNQFIDFLTEDKELKKDLNYLIKVFEDAKDYGSIIRLNPIDFDKIDFTLEHLNKKDLGYITYANQIKLLKNILLQAKLLSQEYDIVVTNPPYMGNNNMNKKLNQYVKENYPLSKTDLFAVFIERGFDLTKKNRFNCMVTMQSWMFLKNFEKFRVEILKKSFISNLLHMNNMVMGIAFGTAVSIFRNKPLKDYKGTYNYVTYNDLNENNVPYEFPVTKNRNNVCSISNFHKIPGNPIAYWADKHVFEAFEKGIELNSFGDVRQGIIPGNTKYFLKFWYEVNKNKIGFNHCKYEDIAKFSKKWFPYNKGGPFKKWYGNMIHVINMENNGYEIINSEKNNNYRLREPKYYFQRAITWSKISSGRFSTRLMPEGYLFDIAGCCIFFLEDAFDYILALVNSNLISDILSFISPTLNYEVDHIKKLPVIFKEEYNNQIGIYVRENIEICKNDWDDYETSWEFKSHPFIRFKQSTLEKTFNTWKEHKSKDFNKLQNNEIELNKIFSEIYSIDVDSNVEDKYVSVTKADYENDIKSFISYAVGCILGRYSLNKEGIAFAGGEFNINNYSKFIPDDDNVIPILDTGYFEDDIVGRFVEFVKTCFGRETLEENLDFIAEGLKNKGNTSREVIRNYFLNDFFKDHSKNYQKCPIYWQFDSGKENGFKCLIYLHRYEPNLVARVRTDYLHKTQKKIEESIANCDNIISSSTNKSEVTKATKLKNKLIKQLTEIKTYDEALAHIASQNIEIDLDDGVKVNYAKFQNIELHTEGQKNKKINLLKKI